MKPGGHQVEGNVLKVGSAAGTVDSLQIVYAPKQLERVTAYFNTEELVNQRDPIAKLW